MEPVTSEAIAILLLVGLSAVFSGMETALLSLSEVKLRARADEEELPRMLRLWLDSPNDVLATLLIGNNLVNITASALATHLTERLLVGAPYEGWGIPIAVGVMTLLVLIFGEVAPKTYAKHHSERYLRALPVIRFSHTLFFPLRKVLLVMTTRVVESLGANLDSERMQVTEEDIEELVRLGSAEGSIDPEATELLTGVLELDEKVAREIMVPRTEVHALPVDANPPDVLEIIRESGYSRYPVYTESIDNVVGVLYLKDLLASVLADSSQEMHLQEIIRKPLIYPENIPVPDLLVAMKRERTHLAIIASEYGGVAGIVTLEDIVEEVFGDIYDEHDTETAPIRTLGEGHWLVEGVVTVSDLGDELGVDLESEEEDYETVAGLLMMAAGSVPKKGFAHDLNGVRFEVLRTDATHILEVSVTHLDPEPAVLLEPQEGETAVGG
ncbi:MAG: hemolysin family protein [Myxococcota bacterium]|nr:hemolysin family protein [Myxococcota bacterium]